MRGIWILSIGVCALTQSAVAQDAPVAAARIIATGISGASAVAQVGTFHPGGPFRDNAAFAAFTQPGRILEAKRVLVASSSNFGAPPVDSASAQGAILSIDPEGAAFGVPAGFAEVGNQASARDGRVQLFAAQSRAFLNSVRTPGAKSAALSTVSNPLGISINNAFGRLWFANAPQGPAAAGTLSIADPTGEPLANAPSKLLGGVFAGDITNRPEQIVPGALRTGVIATAFMGASPDGSKRAVFATLTADGALGQAHTEFAFDGLAPAGSVSPGTIAAGPEARVTRVGMIFNWTPNRILFVTEPERNTIAALAITTDDKVFRLEGMRRIAAPELNLPVDLAPAIPEIANPGFASNTTLAGNADFYVANRGNGTVVRMKQDGTVVAVRRVTLQGGGELGNARLNGIAVSSDAQRIFLTVDGALGANAPGALLEIPAFGATRAALPATSRFAVVEITGAPADLAAEGARVFETAFTPAQGLGPLYNATSCAECHKTPTLGGMGADGLATVNRVGYLAGGEFDPLAGRGGPVARAHSIAELGAPCDLLPGPPAAANVISVRNAPPLYGLGLIDSIADETILAGVGRNGVSGHANHVKDADGRLRVGRFGWKADAASLERFVGDAFRNELGITNPVAPNDLVTSAGCGQSAALEDDGARVKAVSAYLAAMPRPLAAIEPQHREGQELFSSAGCAACHTPALPSPLGDVPLYSDLLLHDLGAALADGVPQEGATGREWRTSPLWGVGIRARFLHDGRTTKMRDAVLAHDGDAAAATSAFRRFTPGQQDALLAFVAAL
jgi:mono/diheme cytochrome c family protein